MAIYSLALLVGVLDVHEITLVVIILDIEVFPGSIKEAIARVTMSRSVMIPVSLPCASLTIRQPTLLTRILVAAAVMVSLSFIVTISAGRSIVL